MIEEQYHTTARVALMLGLSPRTIRKWCLALRFRKAGRDWVLSARQINRIRERAQPARGRPRATQ